MFQDMGTAGENEQSDNYHFRSTPRDVFVVIVI